MTVRVERDGPVTTVVLSRPEARNAVDTEHAQALVDAFTAFEADPEQSVAVLWGEGGTFCAGGDLKEVQRTGAELWLSDIDFPDDDTAPAPNGPMGPSRLELGKPVIAAVSGAAVAGGMELAMWCDIRVAEQDAFFGVYCRRWGIPFLDGGTVRLPRLVGQGRAAEILLTGRTVPASEALSIGLAEKVVPTGTARAAAEALAQEIARFPQDCVRADLQSLHGQYGKPVRQALREEFVSGLAAMADEGVAGAGRFVGGRGRHGDYARI
ncbi:Enoyl-CoA hydratase [Pseudonocardia sp. Ae168_Ps1]|uniref:crotonase/enoyl-CoA hydratase family protein n=1 Tax=unclassified Pseudonocardia TaxID=2619320 RepID=UPI00094B6898|nr:MULTISPECIES: crotonase/enoyl-CoA hydratase family protein [unclassified Pseudonocardia]OLL71064.1 Enoyl-CoA hydratase [Pseudonocardia sp. Ae168_Ps1]OLL77386.1 Enoyl-CoA hydratase [Pseudonocardia sp. Ae150A_Ps1]OLL88502.1 Enoyl-CoA hydratase [Pseudonocardia sp. Ae263_Ps1]OLL91475.1 Enoyl-CoA hydratase [Pseudonocardia sp. Ae356_Ps1]